MSEPIKNGYINWIDGMKISKDHFLGLQRAVEERIRDERALAGLTRDFGILPGAFNGKAPLDHVLTFEGRHKFVLELAQCRGITQGGDRIEVLDHGDPLEPRSVLSGEVEQTLMQEGHEFDILVRVDSLNMAAYGVPDVKESPPRHPYARPKCTLDWVPVKEFQHEGQGLNHLVIARLKVVKNELVQDMDFIPACVTLDALPRLAQFHDEYFKFLKDIERNLFRIVVKLNKRDARTDLSDAVDLFCRAGIQFLERELASFQVLAARQSPRYMVVHAMSFARTFHYAIELLTGKGKDVLLEYIREVSGIQPADYLLTLTGLTDLQYAHSDLKSALGRILVFCRAQRKLMEEWVGLDYIGAKKDKNIFIEQETPVKRTAPQRPPEPKQQDSGGGWDF